MAAMDESGRKVASAINRAALLLALALLAAMGWLWARDAGRRPETPRWDRHAAVALRGPAAGALQRWIVAVNPECSHCRERLVHLARAIALRPDPPALGVLLVDVPRRPDSLAGAEGFSAGVWWDSAGSWRARWRRHAYGEVLVFAPDGSLLRILPPDSSEAPR